jgi:hypothetical protein
MKNFVHTKSFLFEKAQYVLGDGNGNKLMLTVDYKNNSYSDIFLKKNGGGYSEIQKEAEEIAKDLLKRKHKINFVNK